jgi:hypothetical protein
MTRQTRTAALSAVVLLLAPLAACGGGDDRREKADEKAVDGTFVGKVAGTDAFVAVVAAPPARGKAERDVTMYVSDGGRLSESLSGSAKLNSFVATSADDDAEAKGTIAGESVSGSVTLPDGKTARYQANRANAAAGLYDLTVSSKGQLSGASANGVGLTSASVLKAPGIGKLKFADGKRRAFEVTVGSAADPVRLRGGQLRLIVLPSGELSGAGEGRPSGGGGALDFFIRSPAG